MTQTHLFDDYGPVAGFDEMYSGSQVRSEYQAVHAAFLAMGDEEIRLRADSLASAYLEQGVTFGVGGEERPFPLDLVPRIIEAADWRDVDTGVRQRVKALEAFLADVYGPGECFSDGVVPRETVLTSPHYHRVVSGIEPPNGVRVHISGIDLIRDGNGDFRVLEDNCRVPSGVSYVMTNRPAMSAALPEVFADHRIRPVQQYSRNLLAALRAAAPSGVTDPTVVVLTPGVYNSAYFEHTLLARTMGVELVEGRDLVCRQGRVLMRTTRGLEPVHVIYRRLDDEFLDPMQFYPESVLGVPGLINAARAGTVTIANAVGNGVADDKLIYTYVPDLIRYYLNEEPILRNVDTWRLGDPEQRTEVLDRLDELVLKPVDGSGGKGIVIGPAASREELDELRGKIHADPRAWIAQPVMSLSTVPTLVEKGIRPRHVDLRPFAVNDGDDVYVLPGGLTRVALPEGELIVNSSRGGGSKDTWVLADPFVPADPKDSVDEEDESEKARPRSSDATGEIPRVTQTQSQAQGQTQAQAQSQQQSREGVA